MNSADKIMVLIFVLTVIGIVSSFIAIKESKPVSHRIVTGKQSAI